MVDFHTHVLPRIDDGSGSTEESLSLLESLRSQGVDIVCATSHFYPAEQDPESFLRRRGKAWDRLR